MTLVATAVRSRIAPGLHGLLLAALLLTTGAHAGQGPWYRQPASVWTEAMPLGNGRLGAMVFGTVPTEHLQLNEGTLWGGSPRDYATPGAAALLPTLRSLVLAGRSDEAQTLGAGFLGSPSLLPPFLPFGDLYLDFPGHEHYADYRRELHLGDGTATVRYRVGGVTYFRELFASYPDNVIVVRLSADHAHALDFSVRLAGALPGSGVGAIGDDELLLRGQVQPQANPPGSWVGSWDTPGLRYAGRAQVRQEGGTVRASEGSLLVSHATTATVVFTAATSFVDYRRVDGDPLALTAHALRAAAAFDAAALARRHQDDFSALYGRVALRLGPKEDARPTDERLRAASREEDPSLAALYFDFGRYLLISSSRPGGQPANLQGLWNDNAVPPWGSKWTTNINLEMNYWLADAGNLAESAEPLWDLVGDLQASGAVTARTMYGARGWVLHHNTDLWRATAPVDGTWGIWPMGGAWLANQMWDHYEYTLDRGFLEQRAYPALRGAALFLLDTLVEAPPGSAAAGRLVTVPSTSPENNFLQGDHPVHLTYAPTMDIELAADLFDHAIEAASLLGRDAELVAQLRGARARLPALQVGGRGQLQEWIEDYGETEPLHRHVSPLYALYPGSAITPERTPGLAAAARRSLELRGDQTTGWAEAWRTALWARLRDGDHALRLLQSMIATNTLPNLFDMHPPFQIDGNFGGAAAMAEMLVQSRVGEVRLLPALPTSWREGEVRGLRARGGLVVDLRWRNHALLEATLHATAGGPVTVVAGGRRVDLRLPAGGSVSLDGRLARR